MQRSLKQYLSDSLDRVKDASYLQHLESAMLLNDAKRKYWKRGANESILQEFDTLEGFLSCLDSLFSKTTSIRLKVKRHDIHVLYVLEASAAVRLYDQHGRILSQQEAGRGRYYYLPPGEYHIQIPTGKSQLFSYYFRGNTFRKKNYESYLFLHDIIQALRQRASQPVVSQDFLVGPRTRRYIQILCRGLKSGKLKNESFVFGLIHDLIELSAEKIAEAETKLSYQLRIATKAEKLLKQYIDEEGQEAQISKLAIDLKKDLDSINQYHKLHFGISLKQLRTELLLARAKEVLDKGISPKNCAYELRYNSPEAFYHFFKNASGMTATQYIQRPKS